MILHHNALGISALWWKQRMQSLAFLAVKTPRSYPGHPCSTPASQRLCFNVWSLVWRNETSWGFWVWFVGFCFWVVFFLLFFTRKALNLCTSTTAFTLGKHLTNYKSNQIFLPWERSCSQVKYLWPSRLTCADTESLSNSRLKETSSSKH